MRETGYYWAKWDEEEKWESAYWDSSLGMGWYLIGMTGPHSDKDLFKINETRILSPDEIVNDKN